MFLYRYFVSFLLVVFLSLSSAYGHEIHSLVANYVPWGIEEYEFFGLTKVELNQKFKNKLQFDKEYAHAWFCSNDISWRHDYTQGPQFLLKFANGHVSNVQRMFIDGGGCHIMGPVFHSKKEALNFFVNGLSGLSRPLTAQEKQKLTNAKQMLLKIQNSNKNSLLL